MNAPIDHDDLPEDEQWAEVKDLSIGCTFAVLAMVIILLVSFLVGWLRGLP